MAKSEGNTRFGQHMCEMKDIIKMDIKKKKGGIKWIYVGEESNN